MSHGHREVLYFESRDEAIAEALRDTDPGELVEIHDEDCEGHEESDPPHDVVGCTCSPMILIAGAEA